MSKYRGSLKLTSKKAEVTGYDERKVQLIIAEKTALRGAVFLSPVKHSKVDRERVVVDDFVKVPLRHYVHDLCHEKKYLMLDSLLVAVKEISNAPYHGRS